MGARGMALAGASTRKMAAARNRNFHPLARDEALIGRAEGPARAMPRPPKGTPAPVRGPSEDVYP